jgi:hypothetical protein
LFVPSDTTAKILPPAAVPGLGLGESDGEADEDGETDGEADGLAETEGEVDGLTDGEILTDGETDGEVLEASHVKRI